MSEEQQPQEEQQSGLIPGGPIIELPENWQEPWGFNGQPTMMNGGPWLMLWIGTEQAEKEDIDEIEALGYSCDRNTLVGTHHKSWTAKQYASLDADIPKLASWDTVEKPGGAGSAEYKFQHLPPEVCVAHPRWWVVDTSTMEAHRAAGDEPIVTVWQGSHSTSYLVPEDKLKISYDYKRGFYLPVESE